jgi:hypothetical protein
MRRRRYLDKVHLNSKGMTCATRAVAINMTISNSRFTKDDRNKVNKLLTAVGNLLVKKRQR